MKDRRFIIILIFLLIGLSLFIVSQEYHPIIYTNISSSGLLTVNGNNNQSFSFSTDKNYVTIVNLSFPSGDAVRYFVLLNNSYTRNGIETYEYYLIGSGYQNHSFQFSETSLNGVTGNNYVLNITSADGKGFSVNLSYTILIPNKASASPYVLISGLVLIVSSIIAFAVFFTEISSIRRGKN